MISAIGYEPGVYEAKLWSILTKHTLSQPGKFWEKGSWKLKKKKKQNKGKFVTK